jgi:hypothetical protein
VYAIVAFDLDYHWTGSSLGAANVPNKDLRYTDARFANLALDHRGRWKEEILSRDTDFRDRIDTKRIIVRSS